MLPVYHLDVRHARQPETIEKPHSTFLPTGAPVPLTGPTPSNTKKGTGNAATSGRETASFDTVRRASARQRNPGTLVPGRSD